MCVSVPDRVSVFTYSSGYYRWSTGEIWSCGPCVETGVRVGQNSCRVLTCETDILLLQLKPPSPSRPALAPPSPNLMARPMIKPAQNHRTLAATYFFPTDFHGAALGLINPTWRLHLLDSLHRTNERQIRTGTYRQRCSRMGGWGRAEPSLVRSPR